MGWFGGVVARVSVRMPWTGRVVASVSVRMPWSGRVDPNGLVRRGYCGCVGWDALGRPSRPEWICPGTVWIRSFLVETAVPGPLFPALRAVLSCVPGRCLPCFVPLSPMPRPHLLAPGRCLPALRPAAFRALFRCLLCLARSSLRPCRALLHSGPCPPVLRPALSCSSACSFLPFGLHFPALRPALSYTLLLFGPALLHFGPPPRVALPSGKRKPPKAWPSGVSGYCRSRITSQETSG